MEKLPPEVNEINQKLIDHFGLDTSTGRPIWRVVWSEDQFEKRFGTYDDFTSGGIYLRTVTEVREVPKYRQWIQNKYVLERLVAIPISQESELPGVKLSYEPMLPFENYKGEALPPKFEVAKFAIDAVYAATGKASLRKYVDEEVGENGAEIKKKRIDEIEEYLFDSSKIASDLHVGQGVIVPTNYDAKKES